MYCNTSKMHRTMEKIYLFTAFTTSSVLGLIFYELLHSDVQQRWWVLTRRNMSATTIIWLASDTARFWFRPYNICGEASAHLNGEEQFLMAGLCFYRFVHFACVPIYIFGFHHKQYANFTFVKFITKMFNSANEY